MTNNKSNDPDRLITLAIHTYDRAMLLKGRLAEAGLNAVLHNVNLQEQVPASGVRVRIQERDLPMALKVVESVADQPRQPRVGCVLIPVDFSEYSLKACKVGFEYARKIGGSVILLHAYVNERHRFMMPLAPGDATDDRQMRVVARQQMAQFVSDVRSRIADGQLPQVGVESEVTEGIPEECILNCASKNDVVLIVMGTRGINHKEHDMLGSVTAEVLDACSFPIFTVPENITLSHITAIRHVAFFSNLIQQDLISFDIFTRLFSGNEMQVTIIPVVDKKDSGQIDKSLRDLTSYCKGHYSGCNFKTKRLSRQRFIDQFQQYVVDNHIDLIVIPNKKKNIFTRLFNPSIAHRVLFQSDTPMLVVPV